MWLGYVILSASYAVLYTATFVYLLFFLTKVDLVQISCKLLLLASAMNHGFNHYTRLFNSMPDVNYYWLTGTNPEINQGGWLA